jgi:2'-5' RNA ligase
MSPLPRKMENRWANRAEPPPGRGIVSWHLLMSRYPQVCEAATAAQRALSSFPGLHMTPREWLHITTLMAGPAEAITREQMSAMVSAAQARLREVPPVPVFIEKVLYHAEAISLGVQPAQALAPLLDAVRSATRTIIGPGEASDGTPSSWTPHVTVAYSTADNFGPGDGDTETRGDDRCCHAGCSMGPGKAMGLGARRNSLLCRHDRQVVPCRVGSGFRSRRWR